MESGDGADYAELLSDSNSIFCLLPNELVQSILRKLSNRELCYVVPLVCKYWYLVASDTIMWRELYWTQWTTTPKSLTAMLAAEIPPPIVNNLAAKIKFHSSYANPGSSRSNSAFSSRSNSGDYSFSEGDASEGDISFSEGSSAERAYDDDPEDLPWKTLYVERTLGERNWHNGRYNLTTLRGHTLAIMGVHCVDDTVYSCSLDGTLKTWHIPSGKCKKTMTGHTDWVNAFDFVAETASVKLVSCSFDTSIKVWDAQTAECQRTLTGHQNIVWSVKSAKNKLISVSSDSTMRLWDAETGTNLRTISGHEGAIYCLYYDKARNIAATGGADKTIKLWDLNAMSSSAKDGCVATLKGHGDRLCCLQYDGDANLIASGSSDSALRLWDTRMLVSSQRSTVATDTERDPMAACIRTWKGHQGRICCLQFDHEKIVTGSDDTKIKVWDLNDHSNNNSNLATTSSPATPIVTLEEHDYWVNTLQFSDYKLVSGAADDTIKVWDFSPRKGVPSSSSGRSQSGKGMVTTVASWIAGAAGYVATTAAGGSHVHKKGDRIRGGHLGLPIPSVTSTASSRHGDSEEGCVIS